MSEAHATAMTDADTRAGAPTGQYLTFVLACEEYGVDILRVQEIRGWSPVTPIPNTPPYLRGVLNLRGTVVPIIDLRQRLGLEPVEYGPTTVTVVVKALDGTRCHMVGLVVDGVSDVCNVTDEQLKAAPDLGASVDIRFVEGIATIEQKMVILLDLGRLLGAAQDALSRAAAQSIGSADDWATAREERR